MTRLQALGTFVWVKMASSPVETFMTQKFRRISTYPIDKQRGLRNKSPVIGRYRWDKRDQTRGIPGRRRTLA